MNQKYFNLVRKDILDNPDETLNTYTLLFNYTLNEVVSIIENLEDNI